MVMLNSCLLCSFRHSSAALWSTVMTLLPCWNEGMRERIHISCGTESSFQRSKNVSIWFRATRTSLMCTWLSFTKHWRLIFGMQITDAWKFGYVRIVVKFWKINDWLSVNIPQTSFIVNLCRILCHLLYIS